MMIERIMEPGVLHDAFVFSGPFDEGDDAHATEAGSSRHQGHDKRTVLVADDEPLIVRTLLEILRSEGYQAVGTRDGLEAVAQARLVKPDLLLLDIAMPRMNGIDAAREIHGFSPQSRVVLFSGQASSTDLVHAARSAGLSFEIVAKPVKPAVLMTLIRGMLD